MKRMFQVLDEMNANDTSNNTETVGICNQLVEARKTKGGGHVTIGVPEHVIHRLLLQEEKPAIVLLVIDRNEYDRISKTPELLTNEVQSDK